MNDGGCSSQFPENFNITIRGNLLVGLLSFIEDIFRVEVRDYRGNLNEPLKRDI